MKKFSAILLCGLAVMLLTVVLYFTVLGNALLTALHFISLAAILLAEAVTVLYAMMAKGSPRKVVAAVISSFMIPFAAVLSVVYIVNFPAGYGAYIGWYCGGTVVVNSLAFILVYFDGQKTDENNCLQKAKGNMLELRKIVKCILADPAARAYAAQLREVEEKLHYSNDTVIVPEDENIRLLLLQLQENIADSEFNAAQMIEKIEKTIEMRNIMSARSV